MHLFIYTCIYLSVVYIYKKKMYFILKQLLLTKKKRKKFLRMNCSRCSAGLDTN